MALSNDSREICMTKRHTTGDKGHPFNLKVHGTYTALPLRSKAARKFVFIPLVTRMRYGGIQYITRIEKRIL